MFKDVIALGKSMSSEIRNVIIIGSGPAGYTAGLYTSRAMLEPLMFAGYMSGGQLMLTSDVENFPGYPDGIAGPEMMMHLREHPNRLFIHPQKLSIGLRSGHLLGIRHSLIFGLRDLDVPSATLS